MRLMQKAKFDSAEQESICFKACSERESTGCYGTARATDSSELLVLEDIPPPCQGELESAITEYKEQYELTSAFGFVREPIFDSFWKGNAVGDVAWHASFNLILCAARSLRLSIRKVLSNAGVSAQLGSVRQICKFNRTCSVGTSILDALQKNDGFSTPLRLFLDVKMRWAFTLFIYSII